MCKADDVAVNDLTGRSRASSVSEDLSWPEDRKVPGLGWLAVEYDKWTYSYMNVLLRKGQQQKKQGGKELTQDDLFRVDESMETRELVRKFDALYAEFDGHNQRRLMKALWRISAPTFVPAGVCQLGTVICQVAMPLLVRELLRILEENPNEKVVPEGMPYSVGVFLSLFINALCNHRHKHLATKTGVVLRTTVVGVIYDRVLRLTPAGRQGVTGGEVTTLVGIDSQKLFEVTQEAHLAWSMPLSVILVTIFLLLIMGPTTLVGLAVLIFFVPLLERIATKMLSIRRERVKYTDNRVEIISSMLQGIKVTKLNNYEESYNTRINDVRRKEHALLRLELAWWAVTLFITVISPMLAAAGTFATFVLAVPGNVLTSSETFAVLLLFIALRFPITFTGRLIGRAAQAYESIRRISHFLGREVRSVKIENDQDSADDSSGSSTNSISPILEVKNAEFYVSDNSNNEVQDGENKIGFKVSGLSFSLSKGETLAISGPVGGGKSITVAGLLREVSSSKETSISFRGKTAYVSQSAFIINATLRQNILFGLPYEPEWYGRVLDACCLRPDLAQLGGAGDLTEIGERGVTLSGGQKQRVSLARAVYARPDLVLMDDPLSALDAGTSKKVFDNLIKPSSSKKSVLSNAAIVLVTHASHYLNRVDKIILMCDGVASFCGTWDELLAFESDDSKTNDAVNFIKSSVQEAAGESESETEDGSDENGGLAANSKENEKTGKLIIAEEREHGLSQLRTWLLWFKYAGGIKFLSMQFILLVCDRLAYVASEYWLARWTSAENQTVNVFGATFPSQEDGLSAQYEYLKVYASIIAAGMLFTLLRSEWAVTGGARCAKIVFNAMLSRVLLAPVSYFDSTPLGRILNRMSYDVEIIDLNLTEAMSVLLIALSWFTAGVAIMITILPWIAIALVPALAVYIMTLTVYRQSGTDLQRLDAVARSPIQALVSEALEGSTTIRAFQQTAGFMSNFYTSADKSSSALLNFVSAQRWMGIRIELIGSVIVFTACVLVISLNDTLGLEPGIVALLVIWSVNFTITLGFMVDYFSEGEAAITSIERCDAMTLVPQEKSMKTKDVDLALSWPESGRLEFRDVCLRYRNGLPLALNKLSFVIPAGKRCGVVGRTGAGKSSLTVALFRLIEIESGQILLDDVDLATLGLSDVRGRANGMSIIPQDPFIAGTTIRECLDPFNKSSDEKIKEALEAVRLSDTAVKTYGLDDHVSEGGSNFSVGERQLMNLARAFLSKPKLLILDEATASIDGETDHRIQQMIRDRFLETTLITVAHRLNTIMDYDLVLVMDAGRAVEIDTPKNLLENNASMFSELVDATGAESARALRKIAGVE